MKKHRFFNMYLTTTISVALVLFLVGLECIVLLSAHNLLTRVKENLALTVVMTEEADSTSLQRFADMMDHAPYCHHYVLVTKEQALQEHIQQLGEDPKSLTGMISLGVGGHTLEAAYEHKQLCKEQRC